MWITLREAKEEKCVYTRSHKRNRLVRLRLPRLKKNSPYNMMGFVDFRDFKSCTPICVIGGHDSLKDKHKYN